jgi:GH35 family endo-1,4-beta-xylanase
MSRTLRQVLSAAVLVALGLPAADAAAAEFPVIAKIRPRAAKEIASSTWSVGGETLDRDYAVYGNYKAHLGPLGAKRIRVQAGWAKCERTPGVYDFAWLDEVVNDARAQGVQPWLEASYGNTNYPGGGGAGLGGGIPKSPEALAAWDNWVRALVRHFKDRVSEWEVWNEPDIGKEAPAGPFAEFHVRTARIIRTEQPQARIWALALAHKAEFAEAFLAKIQEMGETGSFDAVTFHGYPPNPDDMKLADTLRELLAKYVPHATIRQGETGAPSTSNTFGALRGRPWTEDKQAKWNLRRMLAHRDRDIPFNLFTLMELHYTTGLNTKGLLKAENDKTVARTKPAYQAAQNVFSIFDDRLARMPDYPHTCSATQELAVSAYRRKDGAQAVAVWFRGAVPSDSNAKTPVDLVFAKGEFSEPVLVDLRTGQVRAIPGAHRARGPDGWTFRGIPVYDSPVLIAEKAMLPTLPAVDPDDAVAAYRKLWRAPEVEARIAAAIEKNRKGDATIQVVDAAGKPVRGARIEVRQTGHEFLFGCNAFVLGQLPTPEENRTYEQAFLKLFNFATVPLYWEGTEPVRGELRYEEPARDMWRRPPPDRFLPWAATNGVTLKGHPLLWHAYNPSWLPADAGELRELYRKRFREIASRLGDKIPIWDVVNESLVCRKTYPLYTPDLAYVDWAFAEAVPLFPKSNTMMINEVTEYSFKLAGGNPYYDQVKTMLGKGLPVRGIGFQYHFFRRDKLDGYMAGTNCNPGALMDLYEAFSGFDLSMYVTEITFPSAGEGGEALQAEVVRDHYRLWFGAPRMQGITWWNLGDGTAVKGENEAMGGLADGALKPKASYDALDTLINRDWKTTATMETDAEGRATFRGFLGTYAYTVKSGGAATDGTFQLNRAAEPLTVRIGAKR